VKTGDLKIFFQRWLVNTCAVLMAVSLVPGIECPNNFNLLLASLLLGVLNAVLRPLLFLVSLPLLIFTLGFFTLVINAGLLWLVGAILQPDFRVAGFWPAFWGALIISLVSLLLNSLTGTGGARLTVHRGPPAGNPSRKDNGNGPVIDV
jgi:putative membrane protein